jgi:hypothetical protein
MFFNPEFVIQEGKSMLILSSEIFALLPINRHYQ